MFPVILKSLKTYSSCPYQDELEEYDRQWGTKTGGNDNIAVTVEVGFSVRKTLQYQLRANVLRGVFQ